MLVTVTVKCLVLLMVTVTLQCSVLLMVTLTSKCSMPLIVAVTLQCSVPIRVNHSAVFSAPYGHCHSAVLSAPYGHSPCSVQCSVWSLSLCSLPPLCSGNERPRSSYSLTSKRCSSQSLLPFQHSAVPKILQWISTAIKLQPSLHYRCCFLSPNLSQNFCSYNIIFTGTSADLSTYI